ncbi:diacylglycerol/lipid kinase family protein [Endozoicomonadaceae bacterium StTr2]
MLCSFFCSRVKNTARYSLISGTFLLFSTLLAADSELFTAKIPEKPTRQPESISTETTPLRADSSAHVVTAWHDSQKKRLLLRQPNSCYKRTKIPITKVFGLFPLQSSPSQHKATLAYYDGRGKGRLTKIELCFDSQQECHSACKAINELIHPTAQSHTRPLNNYKALLVYNPVSGKGKGEFISSQFKELMILMGGELEAFSTTGVLADLKNFLAENYSSARALVIIGGDGTLRDAFNELVAIDSSNPPLLDSIAVIPAGSGNGIAVSIGTPTAETAMHSFVRAAAATGSTGKRLHVKQYTCEWADKNLYPNEDGYLLLSLVAGTPADVDIDTEKWRRYGEARFFLGGVQRTLDPRSYPFSISFDQSQSHSPVDYSFVTAMNVCDASSTLKLAHHVKPEDKNLELVTITSANTSRWHAHRRATILLKLPSGNHIQQSYVSSRQVSELTLTSFSAGNKIVVDGELISQEARQFDQLEETNNLQVYPQIITVSESPYYITFMVADDPD